MSIDFNLLSGAKIDNSFSILYDLLRSGQCYLGFARNYETWGQGCLIKYKPATNQTWPNDIVGDSTDAQIYDEYHRLLNLSVTWKNRVFIAKYDKALGGTEVPVDANSAGIVEWVPNNIIETIFISKDWILLRGVDPTYQFDVYKQDGTSEYKYFIFNADKNPNNILEIELIKENTYSGLSQSIQLKYAPIDSTAVYNVADADLVPGGADLERRLNVKGEYLITGVGQDFIDWFETDPNSKQATYFLVDKNGALLLDKITYEETVVTPEETAFVFSYTVNDLGGPRKLRFKISSLDSINNRFAVFHESLPINSYVAPIADNNPPGLSVSYIRHPAIHNSIFDVVGLQQITQGDVWLVKEIPSDNTALLQYYQNLETSYANATLMTVESVVVETDLATDATVVKYFAKTQDISIGRSEQFDSIMLDMSLVGGQSAIPTGEIYRQLFVSWKPKYYDGISLVECGTGSNTGPSYDGRSTFFNPNTHSNDMGTVLYLANKMPVYRKYISGNENFKIVI